MTISDIERKFIKVDPIFKEINEYFDNEKDPNTLKTRMGDYEVCAVTTCLEKLKLPVDYLMHVSTHKNQCKGCTAACMHLFQSFLEGGTKDEYLEYLKTFKEHLRVIHLVTLK